MFLIPKIYEQIKMETRMNGKNKITIEIRIIKKRIKTKGNFKKVKNISLKNSLILENEYEKLIDKQLIIN